MSLVTEVTKDDLEKLGDEVRNRAMILEREFEQKPEVVMLGDKYFLIQPFDYETTIKFSELRQEFKDFLMKNPTVTVTDLFVGKNSIGWKILDFLGLAEKVDKEKITFKQFKYLMYILSRNYIFTVHEDSMMINALEPKWMIFMS